LLNLHLLLQTLGSWESCDLLGTCSFVYGHGWEEYRAVFSCQWFGGILRKYSLQHCRRALNVALASSRPGTVICCLPSPRFRAFRST
ncbi:unnamed protein product, partial [Musa hybrid cultivar]